MDIPRSNPQDWPTGNYMSRCVHCDLYFLGPKRVVSCYSCDTEIKQEIDYEAIRNSKTAMLVKFNEAKKLAEELGYVLVKKI